MAKCGYRKNKRKKKLVILSAFLLIIFAVYIFTVTAIRPVIRTVSQEYVRSLTVDFVNSSVMEVMNDNPSYIELTQIEKDSEGNITLIHTNSATVNALARSVTDRAQKKLAEIGEYGIKIPLGSLSGISFLAGLGPDVSIRAIQVGNIDTEFKSNFTSAGINQTLHRMYIAVTASVNIIIPGAENKVTTVTQVLISESIIIGKIPDVYLDTQSTDLSYNIVP
jgi:sporulation protein YunB